ncbi:MAG: hypothetical protein ACR2IM_00425 [Sediminibacterium sp.]
MSKLIFYGIMIYFLYKLIFNVVVPVSNGVKTVRQNMEQVRNAAHQQANEANRSHSHFDNAPKPTSPPADAEYIDFEEVKKK